MPLKFYNTLTRKKEVFKPLEKGNVKLYTCGPTVYNYAHIGNFRSYVFADLLKRYLKYKGYSVKHVMNITDVDDKTIRDSQKSGVSLKEFTEKYTNAFMEDVKMLNIEFADVFPKATETIPEMVELINKLLEKGRAYKAEDGSIYYSVEKFKKYGRLANIDLKKLRAGASERVSADEYDKEHVQDFALWKSWDEKDGDVFWETYIGKGRPGWHVECSAMSMKFLGESFDMHTGGVDLIFPHHQNEIAQSEGATGKTFVKYWLHNEWLVVDGKKMSKSAGNFYTLRDVLAKGHEPLAVRYVLLSTHYRQQLNFTFEGIEASKNAIQRLQDFMLRLKEAHANKTNLEVKKLISKTKKEFAKSLDDDLEVSSALATVFELVKEINTLFEDISKKDAELVRECMLEFDKVLGLGLEKVGEEKLSTELQNLIDKREKAREEKDWKKSDDIRAELQKKGILLEDTPHGVRWKKIELKKIYPVTIKIW
ncbi:cysteine--tRNA ligase [Candidatus Woesearchaeota archaeon]|nr:cysteine--tRNA ligase [Candidatus Woesearchaeota archaeon]